MTAHPTVTGLTRSDPDLQGYGIVLLSGGQQGGIGPLGGGLLGGIGPLDGGQQLSYIAILSKAWLGSDTSYTLPDLSSQLGYTPLSSGTSAIFGVAALTSNKTFGTLLSNVTTLIANLTNLSANPGFAAGDYIGVAVAFTRSFTVGGGDLTLP